MFVNVHSFHHPPYPCPLAQQAQSGQTGYLSSVKVFRLPYGMGQGCNDGTLRSTTLAGGLVEEGPNPSTIQSIYLLCNDSIH